MEYLTVKEIQELMKCSRQTVINRILDKKNPLPSVKFGREWRIPRSDFEKWLRGEKE